MQLKLFVPCEFYFKDIAGFHVGIQYSAHLISFVTIAGCPRSSTFILDKVPSFYKVRTTRRKN